MRGVSVMAYDEAIKALTSGARLSFDAAGNMPAFRGVYAWWTTEASPRPINPTITAIRAGECVRVGASGVRDEGTPNAARLRRNLTMLPAHLACASAGSRWFGIFPTLVAAETWCRRALSVTVWRCPEDWTRDEIRAAEAAITAHLHPYWTRNIPYAKDPRCPYCGGVVQYDKPTQKRIVPHHCPRCGR